MTDKVEVENVNVPGQVTRVDAAKYQAMKDAMLKVMQGADPMTASPPAPSGTHQGPPTDNE